MPNSRNILELYDVSPPAPQKKRLRVLEWKQSYLKLHQQTLFLHRIVRKGFYMLKQSIFLQKDCDFKTENLSKVHCIFLIFHFWSCIILKTKMGYWYWKELHWYPWNLWIIGRCPHFSITFLQYLINFSTEDMFPKSFLLPLVRVGINCTVVKKILAKYK